MKLLDTTCEEWKGGKCPIDMGESPCPFVKERSDEFVCSLLQLINRKIIKLFKED